MKQLSFCKHKWETETRKQGREFWQFCSRCGMERQLHIVSIKPYGKRKQKTKRWKLKLSTGEINRRFEEIEKKGNSEY